MDRIAFISLADRPEYKDLIAKWLWSFWGAPGNYEFYQSMTGHCRKDDFPMVFIAFIEGTPVGTVALLRADLFSRQDLYPWMADLYVPPEYRNRGIGSALQDFVLAEAKRLGFREIYLYTPLNGYYEKKGWEFVGEEMDRDCQIVRVYKKDLTG
ncbi:MAG: Acetyltransferase (GNAT) family protein [Methanocella sp. PtaU1.Bin125]|nr:MAG: Acetyltransferase (GNAT) family protein [Methanocella sp. PtaU1.Bin125]